MRRPDGEDGTGWSQDGAKSEEGLEDRPTTDKDSEEGEERRPGLLTESKPNPQSLWRLALGPHLIK